MKCLRHLQSRKAVEYAYRIYKSSDGERADRAVWLIKHIANPAALEWIEEFLNDQNVAHWGIGVLDQLLWTNAIPYDDRAKRLLDLADEISSGRLKDQIDFIRGYLSER